MPWRDRGRGVRLDTRQVATGVNTQTDIFHVRRLASPLPQSSPWAYPTPVRPLAVVLAVAPCGLLCATAAPAHAETTCPTTSLLPFVPRLSTLPRSTLPRWSAGGVATAPTTFCVRVPSAAGLRAKSATSVLRCTAPTSRSTPCSPDSSRDSPSPWILPRFPAIQPFTTAATRRVRPGVILPYGKHRVSLHLTERQAPCSRNTLARRLLYSSTGTRPTWILGASASPALTQYALFRRMKDGEDRAHRFGHGPSVWMRCPPFVGEPVCTTRTTGQPPRRHLSIPERPVRLPRYPRSSPPTPTGVSRSRAPWRGIGAFTPGDTYAGSPTRPALTPGPSQRPRDVCRGPVVTLERRTSARPDPGKDKGQPRQWSYQQRPHDLPPPCEAERPTAGPMGKAGTPYLLGNSGHPRSATGMAGPADREACATRYQSEQCANERDSLDSFASSPGLPALVTAPVGRPASANQPQLAASNKVDHHDAAHAATSKVSLVPLRIRTQESRTGTLEHGSCRLACSMWQFTNRQSGIRAPHREQDSNIAGVTFLLS